MCFPHIWPSWHWKHWKKKKSETWKKKKKRTLKWLRIYTERSQHVSDLFYYRFENSERNNTDVIGWSSSLCLRTNAWKKTMHKWHNPNSSSGLDEYSSRKKQAALRNSEEDFGHHFFPWLCKTHGLSRYGSPFMATKKCFLAQGSICLMCPTFIHNWTHHENHEHHMFPQIQLLPVH